VNECTKRLRDQRFSTLDTRSSRFSGHVLAILASLLKDVCGSVHRSLVPFHSLKTLLLTGKDQVSFSSFLYTISSSFWWQTVGENIALINIREYESTTTGKPLLALNCTFEY